MFLSSSAGLDCRFKSTWTITIPLMYPNGPLLFIFTAQHLSEKINTISILKYNDCFLIAQAKDKLSQWFLFCSYEYPCTFILKKRINPCNNLLQSHLYYQNIFIFICIVVHTMPANNVCNLCIGRGTLLVNSIVPILFL